MLQHPIIRYITLTLSLALASTNALAQEVGQRPTVYNSRPQLILGQQSSPRCQLTNAATILVNAAACAANPTTQGPYLNTIILTQDSVYAFPTGLPTGGNFQFGFRIDHGTATCGGGGTRQCTATFAAGYSFNNASMCQPGDSTCTQGQPKLSTGIDFIWCVSESGSPPTVVDCNAGMLAMTPVSTASATLIAQTNCGGTGGGCTTPAINTTGANLYVITITSGAASPGASDLSGDTYTSAVTTGSAGNGPFCSIYYVLNPLINTSETFTTAGGTANLGALAFNVTSPAVDAAAVGANSGAGAVATLQPGALTTTGSADVIVAVGGVNGTKSLTVSAPFTVGAQNYTGSSGNFYGALNGYIAPGVAATYNPTFTLSASDTACAAQASFK